MGSLLVGMADIAKPMTAMTQPKEAIEVVRGSGNVFADLGVPDVQLRQFKSIFAAEIVKALDEEGLTGRKAATPRGNCNGGLLTHPAGATRPLHGGPADECAGQT
jgi:hypothetical protein